ncbi:hypothetical protein Zmor_016424 [Zophobas morio]|uniref:Mon2/Sec7/BIG1-like HUS domain-containing protein n=1 Tax=Zophobas morio TaxID=2755281 RepID=A0AA38HKT2_9CUCU|nr:hypothetical protein Zmor_016424 [Zophobas morio]
MNSLSHQEILIGLQLIKGFYEALGRLGPSNVASSLADKRFLFVRRVAKQYLEGRPSLVGPKLVRGSYIGELMNSASKGLNGCLGRHPSFANLWSCFENIFQVDGYLIFQYLCELSIVNVQGSKKHYERTCINNNKDSVSRLDNSEKNTTLTKRTLALELLLIILKNAGAAFLRHKHFIDGTKRLLCVSLSRNVISSSSRLIELSLALFLVLLKWFKSSLKAQIEILFKNVLLLLLESSTSSLNHKMDVLQAIWYIVSDAQTLQDIFINYDCDISMDNLFTHLIDDLSKIANSGSTNIKGVNDREESVRVKALECLVGAFSSTKDWLYQMASREEANIRNSSYEKRESGHNTSVDYGIAYKSFS